MKQEEQQHRGAEKDSYRNWHGASSSDAGRGYIMNLFGNERVVVRFSDKFEGSQVNSQSIKEINIKEDKNKKSENEEDTQLNPSIPVPPDKPEIENPNGNNHEYRNGGTVNKDKPEIRYEAGE